MSADETTATMACDTEESTSLAEQPTSDQTLGEEDGTDQIVLLTDGAANLVTLDERTGEVIDVEGAPDDAADIEYLVEWVGSKRAWSLARAEGLTAERDALLARIHKQFDPQINYYTKFADWTIVRYYHRLKEFAARALKGKKVKTLKHSLLVMKFGLTKPKTDILENEKAVLYVKEACPDALSVKESVLKTEIVKAIEAAQALPDTDENKEIRRLLSWERAAEYGIVRVPGGEETFKVE